MSEDYNWADTVQTSDWAATELKVAEYLLRERERHERALARVEARIERIHRFGPDDFSDGEVLWFKKRFGGTAEYTYAVVKAGGSWYTSGPKGGGQPRTWSELVEFMSDGVDAVYWANSYELIQP